MQTSVIGFPRVGSLRELKFATEKYFRNEITQEELQETAKEIRTSQWKLQKESGVDYISSNDFSFYDCTLDTAVLFNIVPKRYKELGLSALDTYFAMARGYQGEKGDVKALAMKKWFNTNYHYMVPEIEDDTQVKLVGNKLFEEYQEAKAEGVETKPVVTGAFTLLKLLRYTGKKTEQDFVNAIISVYCELLRKCNSLGVKWLQFDEPYLVHDLTEEDLQLFEKLYSSILVSKGNSKILLQMYFGDIRDGYERIGKLSFDGIGLDFVEGKETANLVNKYGFPKDKVLFAGLVNGKNIWRNHYEKTLQVLDGLKERGYSVVISTSCSLLHVPYTLENETKLSEEVKKYFAFAKEKLTELAELKQISEEADKSANAAYKKNVQLFQSDRKCQNEKVAKRVAAIEEKDFTRLPVFEEREKVQKDTFKLPLFPTTTIGSFPQTADVKSTRTAYKQGKITEKEYVEFNRKKIAECVGLQEEIGIDVLVHGEYERNDMVEYFGENLDGYLFTEKAWVQSYGTRCVKPPIIWGDISRSKAMTVDWSVYAQSLTKKPMKGMLTGPVTILNWSFPREDISLKESAYQIALAIRDEVLDLEKNGISIIQVDEAALREKLPLRKSDWYCEYLDWAIKAFRLVHSGVKPETQIHTHMCYSEFTDIIPAIDNMDADVITFEASRSDLTILDSLKENHFKTQVGPGVYDIHSPRIPTVEEIVAALEKMAEKIKPEKLWVNPDCGLKTRGVKETKPSLENMVKATKRFRKEFEK
ncbi:5-methyltetrahydropteroyltriglutamate--homocysteine methyltransferase [Clostridium sp. CAG:411]|jgi:5-methyltetrahydropteroyltriglutamate--homocysteine methyltransferase|nr:5-methyltetrahydropteroyltriglutamate--homocysteine S-methyltransferase [Lachnospiraceae bacterium]CDE45804.1 5-methyltetrahydropteroyltriglutamate--homocysteine methyltransferase [Clostridium sp. CAG:411]